MGALGSGPALWLCLGFALVALETIAPGIFLIWFGVAALATGAVDYALDLSWQVALVVFAVLALVAVAGGRALTRARRPDSELNRRGLDLVGRVLPLDGPLAGGEGRVRVGDSVWRVVGPDAPAGTAVRVVRLDGATLVVECHAELQPVTIRRDREGRHD